MPHPYDFLDYVANLSPPVLHTQLLEVLCVMQTGSGRMQATRQQRAKPASAVFREHLLHSCLPHPHLSDHVVHSLPQLLVVQCLQRGDAPASGEVV